MVFSDLQRLSSVISGRILRLPVLFKRNKNFHPAYTVRTLRSSQAPSVIHLLTPGSPKCSSHFAEEDDSESEQNHRVGRDQEGCLSNHLPYKKTPSKQSRQMAVHTDFKAPLQFALSPSLSNYVLSDLNSERAAPPLFFYSRIFHLLTPSQLSSQSVPFHLLRYSTLWCHSRVPCGFYSFSLNGASLATDSVLAGTSGRPWVLCFPLWHSERSSCHWQAHSRHCHLTRPVVR